MVGLVILGSTDQFLGPVNSSVNRFTFSARKHGAAPRGIGSSIIMRGAGAAKSESDKVMIPSCVDGSRGT